MQKYQVLSFAARDNGMLCHTHVANVRNAELSSLGDKAFEVRVWATSDKDRRQNFFYQFHSFWKCHSEQ